MKYKFKTIARLFVFVTCFGIVGALQYVASADAIWAQIEGSQLQVKLSGAPYKDGIEFDKVQKSVVIADGETLDLQQKQDNSYLTTTLPADTNVVGVSNDWGKLKSVEPDGHEFLLHYYAKAARSLEDANSTTLQGAQWYIKRVGDVQNFADSATWTEGMPIVARLVEGGYPVAGASVMIYTPGELAFHTSTDETGKVLFRAAQSGVFRLQATWDSLENNHQRILYPYDFNHSVHVHNCATLTFAIPNGIAEKFRDNSFELAKSLRFHAFTLRFSQDSKELITAGAISQKAKPLDSRLRVWDVRTKKEIWRLPAKVEAIYGYNNLWQLKEAAGNVLIMPDYQSMFTLNYGGYDQVDIHSSHILRKLKINNGNRTSIKLSPDQKLIAVGATRKVFIIDAKTLETLRVYNHGAQGTQVYWGPDSKTLLSMWGGLWGLYDIRRSTNRPQAIDVATAKQIHYPRWFYRVRGSDAFAFSPNGNFLAKAKDHTIEIWETPTATSAGKKMNAFLTKIDVVRVMQFSPDGKTLAVGGSSKTEVPVQFIALSQVRK